MSVWNGHRFPLQTLTLFTRRCELNKTNKRRSWKLQTTGPQQRSRWATLDVVRHIGPSVHRAEENPIIPAHATLNSLQVFSCCIWHLVWYTRIIHETPIQSTKRKPRKFFDFCHRSAPVCPTDAIKSAPSHDSHNLHDSHGEPVEPARIQHTSLQLISRLDSQSLHFHSAPGRGWGYWNSARKFYHIQLLLQIWHFQITTWFCLSGLMQWWKSSLGWLLAKISS